ncbi:MAG: hypothetical protein AB8H80_18300 [Planctomycetota bacterium]
MPSPEPAQVQLPGISSPVRSTAGSSAGGSTQDPSGSDGRAERSYQGSYSASHSRELFRSCDDNSDDRLDVFETSDAFELVPSPRDHESYARFDTNRDGFVSWPEFDQRFRSSIANGGTFRVRTRREFVAPEPPPQPVTRLQQFLRLHDVDGDGGLNQAEIQQLLEKSNLPQSLTTTLLKSDVDGSGKVEEAELAPWFQALPILPLPGLDAAAADNSLPSPWLGADADADSAINKEEFESVLRRLDPALLRWTMPMLQRLDKNADGKLSAAELLPPPPKGAGKGKGKGRGREVGRAERD